MSFHFTDAQWEGVGRCIERVGGVPTDWVKGEIEGYINSVFNLKNFEEQKTILFRRVFVAATDLSDALMQLAEIGKLEAEADEVFGDEIIYNDVIQRLKFAKSVEQYADGADWMLGKKLRSTDEPARGRPIDSDLPAFVGRVFNFGRQEQWVLEDKKGSTSPKFIDLLVDLASCARSAGLDHSRDIRRALTRAVAAARVEEVERLRNKPIVDAALDAVFLCAQKKADG
jgi:hypothetical protein